MTTGLGAPGFIPSLFSDSDPWAFVRAEGRTRRWEAGTFSVLLHASILVIAYFLVHASQMGEPNKDNPIFVNNSLLNPITLPFAADGEEGGGGGGGGKNQPLPAAAGRIPDAAYSLIAPEPDSPQPLIPAEDLSAEVQMPIDLPQDSSLPIGEIFAPPNNSRWSGPGSEGGIGTGRGPGVGSGDGPGAGSGNNGGLGGGSRGGIGNKTGPHTGPYLVGDGVKAPVPIFQPLPAYTLEAQKARTEGIVLVQVVIRRDGTVDNIKILRGLGYGLDESAISTIANKWRFRPGTRNGEPVDVRADIEVSFRLLTSSMR